MWLKSLASIFKNQDIHEIWPLHQDRVTGSVWSTYSLHFLFLADNLSSCRKFNYFYFQFCFTLVCDLFWLLQVTSSQLLDKLRHLDSVLLYCNTTVSFCWTRLFLDFSQMQFLPLRTLVGWRLVGLVYDSDAGCTR